MAILNEFFRGRMEIENFIPSLSAHGRMMEKRHMLSSSSQKEEDKRVGDKFWGCLQQENLLQLASSATVGVRTL
jgi:hypothetical protein